MVRLKGLIGIFCGLFAATFLCAQEVRLSASTDRSTVSENESFTFVLLMEGRVNGEPDLTPLSREFEILQRSRNTSIQMVGGQTNQVTEWRLQLMPRIAGSITIPPLELGGFLSNSVQLEVLPAVAADTPGDIFMEVEVTPSTAYVQSQVIYTLRLFRAVSIGRSSLTAPEVVGGEVIIEPIGEDREYQTVRDGRNFVVLERNYAIFPQMAGDLTIEPATFETVVITASGFSSLQRFRSNNLALRVRPVVPPPPEHPDATWVPARNLTFTESWSSEPSEFTLGIPQTRTLMIAAEGVLETQLPELILGQTEGVKQYSDQPELSRDSASGGIQSVRTERFAVIAQSVGEVTIPVVELPWFNVVEEVWEVARVNSRRIAVLDNQDEFVERAVQNPVESASPSVVAGNERLWQGVSAALLVAWLLTVAFLRSSGRGSKPISTNTVAETPQKANQRQLVRGIRSACANNDAETARDLLLEWAEQFLPNAPKILGHVAAEVPDDIARAVVDLERSLYGPSSDGWDGGALANALTQLGSLTRSGEETPEEVLQPLYR
ncbi:MAG: BatD family protein [Pseudomonadota bacterium]|nr:BatD family protein [Pseudomonadota bacterium]